MVKLLDGDPAGRPRLEHTHRELLELVRFLDPAKAWAPFDEPRG